jgi:hypothetical protein
VIRTRVAHAYANEHAFRGFRIFADLLGRVSTGELVVLALTGKRMNAEECAFIDEIFVALAFADPRIWPLKVARIVGAYGRFLPAFAAGYLSLDIEGECVGPGVCSGVAEYLKEVFRRVGGRVDDVDAVAEVVMEKLKPKGARLQGFGVPFRPQDERVEALRGRLAARGWERRPYWRLLDSIATVVRREKKIEPNIGVALAAIFLDLGFESHDLRALTLMTVLSTLLANAAEGASEPAACLRSLPTDCVEYVGRPARDSPRARAR